MRLLCLYGCRDYTYPVFVYRMQVYMGVYMYIVYLIKRKLTITQCSNGKKEEPERCLRTPKA